MKFAWGISHKTFGYRLLRDTYGFSLLELSITIFLTSILCSIVLYTAVTVWRASSFMTRTTEESGMVLNVKRVLTEEIDRTVSAKFDKGILQLDMVDGVEHTFSVNNTHQLILHMQNGGITVLADSVASISATTSNVVKVNVVFVSGDTTTVVADLLGGLIF